MARQNDAKAEDVPESDGFLNVDKIPSVKVMDYAFRPSKLSLFPLYFFISGCNTVKALDDRSMDWEVLRKRGGKELRQASFEDTPVMSSERP